MITTHLMEEAGLRAMHCMRNIYTTLEKDKNKGRENITFVTETTKGRGADRKEAGAIWREEPSGGNHIVICKLDLSKPDF